MKNILFFALLVSGLWLSSCKKKDQASSQTIRGMVFNTCTDSGLANIQVYLKTIKDNKSVVSTLSTISGVNGAFTFENVQIHSDNSYSYMIYIPSISGIGANSPEYTRFVGTSLYFGKDDISIFLMPRVIPGFFRFGFAYTEPNTSAAGDSISVYGYQPVYHKNVPDLPYELAVRFYGNTPQPVDKTANYSMGWWILEIKKWKSGLYTFKRDSIYIGWKADTTYSLTW